jgi:hypothetical protein
LILNTGGGPTDDKPTVTLHTPQNPNEVSNFMNIRVADFGPVTRSGEKEERNSSPSQRTIVSRFAATCVILMAISSRSGKAKVVDTELIIIEKLL